MRPARGGLDSLPGHRVRLIVAKEPGKAGAITHYKMDVHAYHRMAAADVFGPEDRVELLRGELVAMAPIGQDHAGTVNRLTYALVMAFGVRAIVSVQNPVRLDNESEPQPDFAVFRPREDFYTTGTVPGPADTLLLIEVADSSVLTDRAMKLPLYAEARVPELWIIDLKRRVLECYRGPDGERYTELRTYGPDDSISLALAPEVSLSLRQVFG